VSRHVIIGAAQAVFAAPSAAAPPAAPPPPADFVAMALTPDRWRAFFDLVRDTRRVQALAKESQDPVIRREAERLEDQLDAAVGWLAADLAAADARCAGAAAAEGGGL
jgi:hypothetical protein